MLFNLPVSTDTITIPDRFAALESVTGESGGRVFKYNFRIKIDINKALNSEALFLDIRLLAKKPDAPKVTPPAIIPGEFRQSTLILENQSQLNNSSMIISSLAYKRTDITDVIPNTTAANIAAGTAVFSTAVIRAPVPTINASLYQLPLSSSISPTKKVSLSSISSTMVQMLQDPAQLVSFRNSPPALLSRLPAATAMLAKNVMFRPSQSVVTPQIFTLNLGTAELAREMAISEVALKSQSSFYMELKLRKGSGVAVAEAGIIVPHAKILNDFITPVNAPQLSVSQLNSGEVSVGVSQTDHRATRVKIFRRIAPSSNDSGTRWDLVLDDDLELEAGEIRFRDRVVSFNPIMYRAICLGENGRPAENFASRIITPRQELKKDFSGKGTAACALEGYKIRISVSDFPKNAITASVRRYNLTQNSYSTFQAQEGTGFVTVGTLADDQQQFVSDPEDVVEFLDSPKFGSIYKYVPITYTLHGNEIKGKSAIIDFTSSQDDNRKISMTVGKATLTSNRATNFVTFAISGEFTDFGFEEIASVISSANQGGLFSGNIAANRSEFSSLITFLIERENLKTGEVESFGIQEGPVFTDNAAIRAEKNIKQLAEGTRYRYKIIASLRPAETLFPNLAHTDVDLTTLNTFTSNFQKFRGPMQLRKSTLASTARQKDRSAPSALESINPFVAGRTAVQATVEIAIPSPISGGSSIIINERMTNNQIQWVYAGDLTKIDHFQVFLSSGGGYELLGTVHPDRASVNFSYRHFLSETIPFDANYSYQVKPISIDFKEKEVLRSNTMVANLFIGISTTELTNAIEVIQR